jgi:hypothetical protein
VTVAWYEQHIVEPGDDSGGHVRVTWPSPEVHVESATRSRFLETAVTLSVGSWFRAANCTGDAWSDPAHEELAPMPRVDNAMASAHAALTTAFVTAV